jgi:hypothetical protein
MAHGESIPATVPSYLLQPGADSRDPDESTPAPSLQPVADFYIPDEFISAPFSLDLLQPCAISENPGESIPAPSPSQSNVALRRFPESR